VSETEFILIAVLVCCGSTCLPCNSSYEGGER